MMKVIVASILLMGTSVLAEPSHRVSGRAVQYTQQDFSDYYRVLSGARDFSKAQVFLVGETHTVATDRAMFARLAETYRGQNPEHFILLEGYGRSGDYSVLNTSIPNVKSLGGSQEDSYFRVIGWDSQWDFAMMKGLYKVMLESYDQYQTTGGLLSRGGIVLKASVQKLIASEYFAKRNDAMIATVNEILADSPNAQIFILAGSNHFTEDNRLFVSLYNAKIKYTVLIPKEDHSLRQKSMTGLEYARSLMKD